MSNVVTLQDTKKGWGSNAPTSSYSTSTMDKSRMVSTFKPFFGDSKKAANAEETPVEARMRRTLVHTLVKHSVRCATVKGEDRAALIIQRYYRSYAAARVLRRLRWAARRKALREGTIATILGVPLTVARTGLKGTYLSVKAFLMTFTVFRMLVGTIGRIPVSLYRALISPEGAVGVSGAATLATVDCVLVRGTYFRANFQDYIALYVALFMFCDLFLPSFVLGPYKAVGVGARKGARFAARRGVFFAAEKAPDPKHRRTVMRTGVFLGLVTEDEARPKPIVSEEDLPNDPDLVKALKAAEKYAEASRQRADELQERLNAVEQMMKMFGEMSEHQYNTAKEIASEATRRLESTTNVDERIDKRFEDMTLMLREARDEGRADGFMEAKNEIQRFGSLEDEIAAMSPEARAIVEKGLREGMEHGVVKGMALEKERRRKAALSYKVKRALGLTSSNSPEDVKKRAAQNSLEQLKSHIREGGAFPPAQQPRHRRSGSKTSNNSR